jgi:uncharacterized protein
MPGGWELIATAGIVLVSGVIVGLAGFGFALFAVPPLLFFHDPATVVVMVLLLGFTSGLIVIWGEWQEIERSILRALLPWACVGLLVGAAILHYVAELYIKLLASAVVAVFALVMAAGIRLPGVQHRSATAVAGFTSGVLGISAGLPGPPIALLFTAREFPPTTFRVTITTYFVLIDVVAVGILIASDQVHRADLWLAVSMVPAALLGRWLGRHIAHRITPGAFRQVVIGLLLLTGATGVIGAIVSLV